MNSHRPLGVFLVVLAVAPLTGTAHSQEPSRPDQKAVKDERGKWEPLFERHAHEYKVETTSGNVAATRLENPVLRWWQPVRGGDDGALYLWVQDGTPVAAVTFFTFKWPDGNRAIVHERQSLSQDSLVATWRGNAVWKTSAPGVSFQPVPNAPVPAATPAARLRQMHAILHDLSANTTDDKGSDWPLRLLTKPLFRFEGHNDGALFALAQGTDPEAFVLLALHRVEGAPRWEIAIARFTDLDLRVRLQNREIFHEEKSFGGPSQVYFTATVLQKRSDAPADFD
jgi:hypothetical protein